MANATEGLNEDEYQAVVEKAARNQTLARNVFSTAEGRELLNMWMDFYVMCDLYGNDDRAMVYAVAQRDFVLEIDAAVKRRIES